MKAIDTNLLVRIVLNDQPDQVRAAIEILRGEVLVTSTVLLEFIWVLQRVESVIAWMSIWMRLRRWLLG